MKKICKKLLILIVIVVSCVGVMTGCGASSGGTSSSNDKGKDTLAEAKEKGVLTVASSNDAPFAFIDSKTNEFTGIDAEIITEAAKRIGINKVEMKQIPFENLLVELNNNTVDMVTDGMYVKDERKKKALFTNIWYKEGEAIVVPKDSKITSKDDLKNAVVGGQKGTAFLETAQKWKNDGLVKDVTVFGSQSELMLAANTGKIDACITDGMVAGYTLSQDSSLNLKILSPYKAESTGMIAAAVRKNDTALADAINEQIDNMKNDGTILKLLKKYGMNEDYFVSVEDGHISDK
ncbi:L-cystine-binding protein TcyA precursor [Clostridium saccharobutylicum]|uniref:substrate-binding periplasmic protein n=1 Tax=Clostridium saccharobutylicum TaxID=169679 RepID=UPI000983EBB4|nr:ABC transporter substrate-binding protein [Clostridium saccharobutylicum]AQS08771.1 L-cystine-binding protein TcyA precursor [Clostridium saccharobutylicum]MBC2437727.1 amino acid ABC transporter substrate-binding protein [Clostridium saccharobutylicum]NSB90140.1 polar amino acid transport system substrate-binding protein [Clostridium saccharobutylicum]NYC28883.1 polar amino acid transport system substrate-binding protein [Clostridium saccharobutylicum]OOM17537.1 L-cystine-binding protein T